MDPNQPIDILKNLNAFFTPAITKLLGIFPFIIIAIASLFIAVIGLLFLFLSGGSFAP